MMRGIEIKELKQSNGVVSFLTAVFRRSHFLNIFFFKFQFIGNENTDFLFQLY